MRITALVKSHEHVCCRYRVAAFRAHLANAGHAIEVRPWSNGWMVQQMLPSFIDGADVLIVQRKLFPTWQLKLIRRRVRWLIYDFDDSIFLNSSYNPRGQDCPKRYEQFKQMVQMADVVVAGNPFLYEQASVLTDPAKVRYIPTCVDPSRYRLARHDAERGSVKLTWIGSSSTLRGLVRIGSLLNDCGKRVPGLELRIICDRSLRLEHLPIDFRPWSEATEANDLADADIGISWLPDDLWSEGKCGLKLLQYMAAGLPVIANPVGVQKNFVRHGETGFLVESPDEWREAIELLANDPALRREMGRAGRRFVEAEFGVACGGAAWQWVLHKLAGRASDGIPDDSSLARPANMQW